ncbi:Nucleobase-ascorbate transporter 4 [Glycine soja]|uniref:Nucleobase-ascorbate transporter 4 n=1 Tax=Glycine soja TaxID=3848 RepID=A0A445ISS0_GLYSO|nr:Nucleobase-ascorbate transporter 4 [Glycine soja]
MEACSCGGEKQNMDEFEFELHRVKQQLPSVQYCVASSPSWPEGIRVGFLHCLVALGTNVMASSTLVPLMGGDNEEKAQVIETLLFVAAINTLPQTWFGTRLPVVVVASYTFLIPAVSVAVSKRMSVLQDPHQKFIHSMRAIQGALITASVFQISIGFFGFWRLFARCLGPFSVVPLVTLTGLGLFLLAFPRMVDCAEIGLPAFLILVIGSQLVHTKKRSSITQSSCRTDRSGLISAAPWIRVPYPFQWGPPSFSAGDIFATVAASLVAIVESTGTFIAAWRLSKATPILASVLGRGVGWLVLCDSLILHFENAELLGLTRIGSRKVIQISAGFMLFFSIIGKFGAFLASIPLSIVAAIYCVLFAFVAFSGLGYLQFCNLNSYRSMFILGVSLGFGLSVPKYFNEHGPVHTGSTWFNNIAQAIFSSPATVAIIDAYILDLTVSRGERSTRRDGGRHWWEKFRTFNQDIRTEDFFSLSLNFNRFFPSH